WVAEGRVRYHGTAKPPPRFRPVELTRPAEVALLTSVFGSQGRLLDGFAEKGFDGLVVEAFGVGHLPESLADAAGALAEAMPVVLASRIPAGEIFTETYGYAGGEIDLIRRGFIPAGPWSGRKARILLTLALMQGASRQEIAVVLGA
ncbi:MAG: hypothetical protein MI755_17245, partial [Sphingomonadales bacterium]|nr:hypothetical protein [Sphingomonadales bacterium]